MQVSPCQLTAEGVETVAQHAMLRRFGCDCFQGHLFCQALPIEKLEVFMKQLPLQPPVA